MATVRPRKRMPLSTIRSAFRRLRPVPWGLSWKRSQTCSSGSPEYHAKGAGTMKLFGNDASSEKIERLKTIPVFHGLTRKELLEVNELLHERSYEKDEVIFEEGDE